MDIKTLEYMEERSQKGRELVEQIEKLKRQISQVKRAGGIVDIYTGSQTIRPIKHSKEGQFPNDYQTQLTAHIYNTFITVTHLEIQSLEQELAEL